MNGIVSLIKPPGITSHDMVGLCRRILGIKKIGHSGTLDPLACGVLPLYIGKATRLIEYGASFSKTYIAEGRFGVLTDTEDITGALLDEVSLGAMKQPSVGALQKVMQTFKGPIQQRPSSYSAIKVDGQKAYDLARAGQEVILPEREVHIYDIGLKAYHFPYFTMEATVSGGTYIRALLRDIFAAMQTIGTMTHLHRTRVGNCSISTSATIEEFEKDPFQYIQPMKVAVAHLPMYECTTQEAIALCQGKRIVISKAMSRKTVESTDIICTTIEDKSTDSKDRGAIAKEDKCSGHQYTVTLQLEGSFFGVATYDARRNSIQSKKILEIIS